jgi:hypothetical protein
MSKRSERSPRAQARALFREAMEVTPLPSPPPSLPVALSSNVRGATAESGGRGQTEQAGEAKEQSLTERARALYEDTVVPVREIARLVGVTERTILKYAAKHDWKPRYHWVAGAAGVRHRRWQPNEKFAPARGAGARFIKREDAGKPVAVGLMATDPAVAARAYADCGRAQTMAKAAQLRAARAQQGEAQIDAIAALGAALAEIVGWRRAREKSEDRARRANAEPRAPAEATRFEWRNGMHFIVPRAPRDARVERSNARSRRADAVERALWVIAAAALARWESHLGRTP